MKQLEDEALVPFVEDVAEGRPTEYHFDDDEVLCFKGWIVVPDGVELRQAILVGAHTSPFVVHLGSVRIYRNLKSVYFWVGLKKEVTEFVSWCVVCQRVKAEHQFPTGLLQLVQVPEWK